MNSVQEQVIALKNGDFDAFNAIYKAYYLQLANYVNKMAGDRQLAEDIAQETFYILWKKRDSINPDLSLKSFLYKICHNEFLKHLRSKSKEREFLDGVRASVMYELETANEDSEKIKKIRKIIEGLSPKCKEVFIASKYQNLSHNEIAENLGISKKTVEVHINKAYTIIRKKMGVVAIFFFWIPLE